MGGVKFNQYDLFDCLLDYLYASVTAGPTITGADAGYDTVDLLTDQDYPPASTGTYVKFSTAGAKVALFNSYHTETRDFSHVAIRTHLDTGTLPVRVQAWISDTSGHKFLDHTFTVGEGQKIYYAGITDTDYRYVDGLVAIQISTTVGAGQTLKIYRLEMGPYRYDSLMRLYEGGTDSTYGYNLRTFVPASYPAENAASAVHPLRYKRSDDGESGGIPLLCAQSIYGANLYNQGSSELIMGLGGSNTLKLVPARTFVFQGTGMTSFSPPNIEGDSATAGDLTLDGATYTYDTSEYLYTTASWKITKTTSAGNTSYVYLDSYPNSTMNGFDENMEADGVFYFSFWGKSSDGMATFLISPLACYDPGGWTTLDTFYNSTSGEWEFIEGTFTIPFSTHTIIGFTIQITISPVADIGATLNINEMYIGRIS